MYRLVLILTIATACAVWVGADAFAQTNEFQLPPVKLKPDRPTKVEPIPPTPDDRETPKETPPAEKPLKAPKKAPPVLAKPAKTPGKAPPAGAPAEPPAKLPGPAKGPPKTPPKSRAQAVKEAEEFFGISNEKPVTPPKDSTVTPADLPMPKPAVEPKPKKPAVLAVPGEAKEPTLPAPPGEAKQPPRPTDLQAETIEAQIGPTVKMDVSGLGEVGLVEEVARIRKTYGRALKALRDFYTERGTVHKLEWITSEMTAFEKVPKIQYLIVPELAGPDLRPTRSIEAADQLYAEGVHYKDYPAFPPGKKDYLKIALEKFRTIIEKYPESDKIDDAAFRMGEIYGGWYFQDYARAVQSYQRCWEWNSKSEHPALFNAAKIYDEKLKNRVKAVELYNRVVAETADEAKINEAQNRLRALTGR